MILEVKRAFTNFLKINSDSTSTGHMKNGIQTGSQGNSSLTDQDCPNPLLRNSVHHGDGCDKTKEYCHRFGFRGSTVSDSLDLASHRNQTSSHPKFRQESIELGLICPEKVYSTKQSSLNGHLFCPVPLDGDTFCDHCNQPIWELGWRPVCLKCAKCHMTCHWLCKDEVTVLCDEDAKCIHQTAEESPFLAEVISNEEIENVSNQLCQLSTYLENDEKSTFEDTLTKPSEVDSGLGIQLTTESDIRLSDTVSPEEYCTVHNFIDKVVDHIPTEVTAEINSPSSSQQHFKSIDRDSQPVIQVSLNDKISVQQQNVEYVETFTGSYISSSSEKPIISDFLRSPTLSRRATDIGKQKRPMNVKLAARHSFLSGSKPHVCLTYDFSSLDKEAILSRGISVRQLSPSLAELKNTSKSFQDINITTEVISKPDAIICSNESSGLEQEFSDIIGLASVIQTTQEFIRTKPKRSFQTHLVSPNSLSLIPMVVGPRAELPWSPDRLKLLIKVFSMNEFGLQVTNLGAIGSCDCEGQVRVHINLLRPIQMLLTARPASIFDVVGTKSVDEREDEEEEEEEEENDDDHNPWFLKSNNDNNGNIVFSQQCAASNVPRSYISAGMSNSSSNEETHEVGRNVTGLRRHLGRTASRVSTFRLPRGSTKLLHVRLSTTAQMVICALLDRFGIRDNPQKFALYEHTIEGDQKVSVRKLFDDESPLGLLFRWADQDPDNFNNILSVKRLVLQENETGDIEWSTFSLSELHTFLGILNREENDYRRRIEMKYEIRRKEIKRLMDLHVKEMESSDTSISDPYSFCASHVTTVITEGYDNETATEELCDNPDPTTYSCIDSLSAPVSPTLFRKKEGQSQLKDEQSNYHEVSNSPDSGSSPELTLQHKTIRHSQLSNAISTLPRSPPTKTSEISTPSKLPSIFKSFSNFKAKKAEIAQQKRLAKLEKARIKAEQQKEQTKSHSQSTWRWRGFGTLSPSNSASISPPLPSHQ